MKDTIIKIVVAVLTVVVLVASIKGTISIIKENDNAKVTEEQTEIVSEITTEATTEKITEAITTESTTTEVTTELTTEAVTEMTTEELTLKDDRDAPVFLIFSDNVEIKQGNIFDVNDYVGYGDDVDRNPLLTVTGEVDPSVLGTYPLTLTLTDEAGHSRVENMNVHVVSEYTQSEGRAKEDFSTFSSNYKTENTILGIDVSRWQGDIDFEQVKNAGCEFVIIRIGGYDDGSQYEDKYYMTNIRNAKAAGLKVGIYWHAEESSLEEIKSNVAYMMGILNGEELDFPIVYDWEDFTSFQNYNMNLHDLNTCFEAFYNEVKAYGSGG